MSDYESPITQEKMNAFHYHIALSEWTKPEPEPTEEQLHTMQVRGQLGFMGTVAFSGMNDRVGTEMLKMFPKKLKKQNQD